MARLAMRVRLFDELIASTAAAAGPSCADGSMPAPPAATPHGARGKRARDRGARREGARGGESTAQLRARVAREVLRIAHARGEPGTMPPIDALQSGGGRALVRALREAFGGRRAAAAALNLVVPRRRVAVPPPADLADELLAIASTDGTLGAGGQPQHMPTAAEMRAAGRTDLANLVTRAGGQGVVANGLGLRVRRGRRPTPAPELPADLAPTLAAISATAPGRAMSGADGPLPMPTAEQMREAGRADLVALIARAGGQNAVAARVGLRVGRGRRDAHGAAHSESEDERRARVAREVLRIAHARGEPGTMPPLDALQSGGGHALVWAVRTAFGGVRRAALALGLAMPRARVPARSVGGSRQPRGYWTPLETVRRELLAFIRAHGTEGVMPAALELRVAGQCALAHAIERHGGLHAVGGALGLRPAHGRAPIGYWAEAERLDGAVLAFVAANGTEGVMPTVRDLQRHGRHDLAHAICAHHGGRIALERRTGLRYVRARPSTPRGYWRDVPSVHAELLAYVRARGTHGVMPTGLELKVSGARGRRLLRALEAHPGGIVAAARATGLQVPTDRFAVWVIDATTQRPGGPGGTWQRQVATVDSESLVARRALSRRARRADPDADAGLDDGAQPAPLPRGGEPVEPPAEEGRPPD
ncbi:hypothetical protein KFE25_008026 [Diacronema lutheri]|uniref:Uncharacterized protein n=2 Tax=Diacronema lutheri TaxID=2081491 RepID=A0A8J5XMJ5_DIALT|nr:hypothetical protein KFE25_008026 [Diacronema lutheri]